MNSRTVQNGANMTPRWGQNGENAGKENQRNKNGGGARASPPMLAENGANIAPTWLPKWSQYGQKIDPQIEHFFDASWDRFLDGF